jgi:hypothetical protein
MKNNVKENIAIVVIALITVASIMMSTQTSTEYVDSEGKTPYELYPDAYENSSFNPANGYIYNKGINYENR